MTLLLQKPAKPGTHAIVIGVGRYPWLVGGKGKPRFGQNDGMAQLTSPPSSGRAFATWLLKTYDNPTAPLASVDLLLSDAKSQKFKGPKSAVDIEPATFANVSAAIKAWTKRATKEDDLLLFFFSGHGISAAWQTTLLCEDYGSDALAPLSHTIDFNKLYIGLDRVAARRQCFFVDACRVATANILETFNNYGQPIIDPVGQHNPKRRQAPILNSTLAGQLAYGRKGKPSYFTEAVLRGFDGPATDNAEDGLTWWVQADVLLKALPKLLERVAEDPNDILQEAAGSEIVNLRLHRVKEGPRAIPVDVWCDPEADTANAILTWAGGGKSGKRKVPSADRWRLELDEGDYTFEAAVSTPQAKGTRQVNVRPTFQPVRIKLK